MKPPINANHLSTSLKHRARERKDQVPLIPVHRRTHDVVQLRTVV